MSAEDTNVLDAKVDILEGSRILGDVVHARLLSLGLAAVPDTLVLDRVAAKSNVEDKLLVVEDLLDIAATLGDEQLRGSPGVRVGGVGVDVGWCLGRAPGIQLDELISPLDGI